MIYKLGSELQTVDFADEIATKAIIAKLEYNLTSAVASSCILCMLHEHTGHEDNEVFPRISAFEPAMIKLLIQEHQEVARKLIGLSKIYAELNATNDSSQRIDVGKKLNRSVNELFAYYATHLAKEEAIILPATWKHFNDEQLLAIKETVDRNISPDRYAHWMTWVLASLNVNELSEMFDGLKKGSTSQALEKMVHIANTVVEEERWKEVKRRVGL
jgi:hypothetical protein